MNYSVLQRNQRYARLITSGELGDPVIGSQIKYALADPFLRNSLPPG